MTGRPRRHNGRWLPVFGPPLLIGALSIAGLLAALLDESWGRGFSWFALGLPLAIAAWVWWRR